MPRPRESTVFCTCDECRVNGPQGRMMPASRQSAHLQRVERDRLQREQDLDQAHARVFRDVLLGDAAVSGAAESTPTPSSLTIPFVNAGIGRLLKSNASRSTEHVPAVSRLRSSTPTVPPLESLARQLNDMSLSESDLAANKKRHNHATTKAQNVLNTFRAEIDNIAEALTEPYTAKRSTQIKERITMLRRGMDKVTRLQVHEQKASLLGQLDALDTRLVELDTLLPNVGPIFYDTSKFSAYECV